MKDTPAGAGGSEGITTAPGAWAAATSITGNPPCVGTGGMDTGLGCIIDDPGGEEPPGGKKTWVMAPVDIHGLALAIQSPVLWLPKALNIQTNKHTPRCSVELPGSTNSFKLSQIPWVQSWFPCVLCPPVQVDQERSPYPGSAGFPSSVRVSFSLSNFFHCPGMTSMSGVCERPMRDVHAEGKTPSCCFYFPHLLLFPSTSVQRSSPAGEKVQSWCYETPSCKNK